MSQSPVVRASAPSRSVSFPGTSTARSPGAAPASSSSGGSAMRCSSGATTSCSPSKVEWSARTFRSKCVSVASGSPGNPAVCSAATKSDRPAIALALPDALFLDRQLGGRMDLEPFIRDRLAALDREAVRARRQPLLGTLDGRELRLEVRAQALVELVLVEVGGEIPGVLVVRLLGVVLVLARDERPLDPHSLGVEQLGCAFGIHPPSLRAP